MRGSGTFRWTFILLALLAPQLAQAHPGVGAASGFSGGLLHPFTGLDHMLAMTAVGLLAAQRGGRALWLVPLAFLSMMALGAFMGAAGVTLPFVEQGVAASVLIFGVVLAASFPLPAAASVPLVGLFALFHGHTHGTEMAGLGCGLGFMLATACLHLGGIGLGLAARRAGSLKFVRYAGGAMAACGVYLIITA